MNSYCNFFFQELRPYWKKITIGLGFIICSVVMVLYNAQLLGEIIDSSNTVSLERSTFYKLAILFTISSICRALSLYCARVRLVSLSRLIEYKLRTKIFNQLSKADISFYASHSSGDLISRIISDIEHVRMLFGPVIMYTMNITVLAICISIQVMRHDIELMIYLIIPILVTVLLLRQLSPKYIKYTHDIQKKLGTIHHFVNERIQGIRILQLYRRESIINNDFKELTHQFYKTSLQLSYLNAKLQSSLGFIAYVLLVITLGIGGYKVSQGTMSLGTLVEFLRYMELLSIPLIFYSGWIHLLIHEGLSAFKRIKKIMDAPSNLNQHAPRRHHKQSTIPELRIVGLNFAYKDKTIFNQLYLRLAPGEKLGIYDPIGSGKTTFVDLLLQFSPTPKNTIFLNNKPIEDIHIHDVRSMMSVFQEDNFIFDETISENIQFFDPSNSNMDKIKKLSQIAKLDEDINLFPKQYQEKIGERGITLSGGQKQRLGIARTLYHEAPILIFDNAFSNIDNHTRHSIIKCIVSHYGHCSILILDRDIHALKKMDRILLLEKGQLYPYHTTS